MYDEGIILFQLSADRELVSYKCVVAFAYLFAVKVVFGIAVNRLKVKADIISVKVIGSKLCLVPPFPCLDFSHISEQILAHKKVICDKTVF